MALRLRAAPYRGPEPQLERRGLDCVCGRSHSANRPDPRRPGLPGASVATGDSWPRVRAKPEVEVAGPAAGGDYFADRVRWRVRRLLEQL